MPQPFRARTISKLSVISIMGVLGYSWAAIAGDAPAVSALNGRLSAEGGRSSDRSIGLGVGTVAIPLGQNFGAQLNAGAGKSGHHEMGGIDGQVFWRDPAIGMVGVGYVHSRQIGTNLNRFLGISEAYFGPFTIYGKAGFQNGDVGHGAVGQLKLSYYPIEDLKFTVGTELNPDWKLGLFEAEYRPGIAALPGAALFARGAVSGQGAEYGVAGIRFYFGQNKPLIRHHREDNLSDLVTSSLNNTPLRTRPAPAPAPVIAPVIVPVIAPVIAPVIPRP